MAPTRLQENKYIWKNDHKERKKDKKKSYVHEIPFVYATAIHRQNDPVIELALTIVTMQLGRFPMAERKTPARSNG